MSIRETSKIRELTPAELKDRPLTDAELGSVSGGLVSGGVDYPYIRIENLWQGFGTDEDRMYQLARAVP
jgi:hypothetical protein